MRGQLSNSSTVKFSAAQGDVERCRIPSSVINSQWERLCSKREFQSKIRKIVLVNNR